MNPGYQVEGLVPPAGDRESLNVDPGLPGGGVRSSVDYKAAVTPSARNVVDMPAPYARMLSARCRTPPNPASIREARERVRDRVVPTGYPG
jgi:hypothetical protein